MNAKMYLLPCAITAIAAAAITAITCHFTYSDDEPTPPVQDSTTKVVEPNYTFLSFDTTSYVKINQPEIESPVYGKITLKGILPLQLDSANLTELNDSLFDAAFDTTRCEISEAILHALTKNEITSADSVTALDSIPEDANYISELLTQINIQSLNNGIASFGVHKYNYSYGAAHGNSNTSYINLYIPKNIILTPKNLFLADYTEDVIYLLRKKCKEQNPFYKTSVDSKRINRIPAFRLDSDGAITFVFESYEIGPYSAGEVEVKIYHQELEDCLSPLGYEVFGL